MGFNKRYVSLDNIKKFVDNGYPVCKIFDVDALFLWMKSRMKYINYVLKVLKKHN